MPAYIRAIGTANPAYRYDQKQLVEFMLKTSSNGIDEGRIRALYRATGIHHRYSVLSDYGSPSTQYTFYPDDPLLEPFPDTARRMELYKQEAASLAVDAISDCLRASGVAPGQITHLITVSCTGFYAPGIDVDLINLLGLGVDVKRIAINYMGCYAALNAMRVAKDITTANPAALVLIICVELCSIHFQKNDSEDAILANALFGDGAAAVLVETEPKTGTSLVVDDSFSHLIPDGHEDMAWSVGNLGFEMKLSTYVPDLLGKGIKEVPEHFPQIANADYFAVHPGGIKILRTIAVEMGISEEDLKHSYDVLREFGNMSSPTILFVLKHFLDNLEETDHGKSIISIAFGPGISLEILSLNVHVTK